jgi:hypothetical protein
MSELPPDEPCTTRNKALAWAKRRFCTPTGAPTPAHDEATIVATQDRERLPNRRLAKTFELEVAGLRYTAPNPGVGETNNGASGARDAKLAQFLTERGAKLFDHMAGANNIPERERGCAVQRGRRHVSPRTAAVVADWLAEQAEAAP